jgi:membrane-associated phospholipid phosphatase
MKIDRALQVLLAMSLLLIPGVYAKDASEDGAVSQRMEKPSALPLSDDAMGDVPFSSQKSGSLDALIPPLLDGQEGILAASPMITIPRNDQSNFTTLNRTSISAIAVTDPNTLPVIKIEGLPGREVYFYTNRTSSQVLERFNAERAGKGLPSVNFKLAPDVWGANDACQASSAATPTAQNFSGGELKLSRIPVVLGHNLTSNLFTRANLLPFLIGSAAALAIAPADQEISRSMYNHAHEFGDGGQLAGPIVTGSITGGAFLASRLIKNEHFRVFGYGLAQAFMINGILTQGIKYATHRMRPDQSASDSFPSGHTSSAFAVATVVTNQYGKEWGIPLYVFAGLVGVSRVEKGKHWPSDTIAGAALGYISGRTAILGTKREVVRKKSTRLIIMPTVGPDWRGISAFIHY